MKATCRVIVYTKSVVPNRNRTLFDELGALPDIGKFTVRTLPNLGGIDHTILSHIRSRRWEHSDTTIFLPDTVQSTRTRMRTHTHAH